MAPHSTIQRQNPPKRLNHPACACGSCRCRPEPRVCRVYRLETGALCWCPGLLHVCMWRRAPTCPHDDHACQYVEDPDGSRFAYDGPRGAGPADGRSGAFGGWISCGPQSGVAMHHTPRAARRPSARHTLHRPPAQFSRLPSSWPLITPPPSPRLCPSIDQPTTTPTTSGERDIET